MDKLKQNEEAIYRMELLSFPSKVREEFCASGKVHCSEDTRVNLKECDFVSSVREFEKVYNALVYYGIHSVCYGYEMLSLLFVSSYESAWQTDRLMLMQNQTIAYILNLNVPEFSEFGTIVIDNIDGTLIRKV